MSEYRIQSETLEAIGDAIRSKTGGSALINPEDMADEIASISGGGGGLDVARLVPGTYTNGTVDADGSIHKTGSTIENIPLTKPITVSIGDVVGALFIRGTRQYASIYLFNGSTQIAQLNMGNITPPKITNFTLEASGVVDNITVSYNSVNETKISLYLNENLVLT